jgi:ribosome-binding factor A
LTRRTDRLNVLFREELSTLIRRELRDPRLSEIFSITRVEVSPDLENASVFISVLGEAEEKQATIDALSHAAPFLRRHLLERMHIRKVPALHFMLDETIEEAARILDLMKEVSDRDRRP